LGLPTEPAAKKQPIFSVSVFKGKTESGKNAAPGGKSEKQQPVHINGERGGHLGAPFEVYCSCAIVFFAVP